MTQLGVRWLDPWLWGATLASGLSDALDLPEKLKATLPPADGLAEAAAVANGSWVWFAIAAGGLLVLRAKQQPAGRALSWWDSDQAQASVDQPAYPALIKFQPVVLDLSDVDLAEATGLDVVDVAAMRKNPTRYPRRDIIEKLCAALLLPRDACTPVGALTKGRLLSERHMRLRLGRLGSNNLVRLLGSDGHDRLHDVMAGHVKGDELRELYGVSLVGRYVHLNLSSKRGVV